MRIPVILETAWSMITGKPILVGPEAVGGPYSPKVAAQVLLTRVRGLLGEFGKDKLETLGKQRVAELEQEFVSNRATLLEHCGFKVMLPRTEFEKEKLGLIVDLSLEDIKKILDYTPKYQS